MTSGLPRYSRLSCRRVMYPVSNMITVSIRQLPSAEGRFWNFTLPQIYVILDGAISMDSVIWRVKNASIGQQLSPNVVRKSRSLLMLPTMRKMFIFNIAIMETNPGWAWMTSPRRVTLLGRIAAWGTLQLGRRISRITSMKKTVFTHLV